MSSGADAGSRPGRRRRWLALTGLAIGSSVGLGAAIVAWHWHQQPARVAAALPPLPDLEKQPIELQERMRRAHAAALERATAFDGVVELGRLFQANGFYVEAEACWRWLIAEQPRQAQWAYYLADLRRVASDYDGMSEWLKRTTQLAPSYSPAWLVLADLKFKSGSVDEAERAYWERLTLVPGDPYARLGLARIASQRDRQDEFRAAVEQLVRDAPGFPPAHSLYADLLTADGDDKRAATQRLLGAETRVREAEDPWLDALIDWSYDYELLCLRATTDVLSGKPDRGQALAERAITLRPEALAAYEVLGNLYLDRKQGEKARATYELGLQRAAGARPSATLYANLSRAHRMTQQPADAVRVAREGLTRVGREATLFQALGDALGEIGEREAAVDALSAAVECNTRDAGAHYNLAVALIAVRRLDDALEALHRSLAAQPTFPPTLSLLGQIAIDSSRWSEAVTYLQPLYDLNPELPEARDKMAFCHLRAGAEAEQRGDVTAAEQNYRAGLAIVDDHAELPARLGALLLVQRRFADAIVPLEAYHRGQPDNPQSALFLGQAYAAVGRRDEARKLLTQGAQLAERAGNLATARHCQEILRRLP